jgi:serine protease
MDNPFKRWCRHGVTVLAFVLALAPAAHAKQRILQLAEDSAQTKPIAATQGPLANAPPSRVCEAKAKWIRLNFSELTLRSYDTLELRSSGGDRYVFAGNRWNDRSFSARALRGSCVDIRPYFGSADSHYQIESFQFGTQALEATTVVVAGAGDICDSTGTKCQGTSDQIVAINPTAVFTAGDNAYTSGTLTEYNTRYEPTWGRFKALTSPSPGNHDYNTTNASGYFDYFNGVGNQTGPAGDRSKGYYSYDVGDWHFIALNTMSGGTVATTQIDWLKADLAATTKPCVAAYFHHPLLSIGNYTGYNQVKPFYDALYAAHADLVLVGHDHNYQRYKKMDGNKVAKADGLRQILVGTGGRAFYSITGSSALLEASNDNTHGVLKLTLTATGYTSNFVPSDGTYTDTVTDTCNAKGTANVPPVANFSFTTSSLTATFADSSTDSDGTIASRAWNFGDGSTSAATNPSHAYASAGSYNVTLTVTDDKGATHSVTKTVTVSSASNANPVANFSFTTSDLTATFTDASTDSDGSIASRSWNFGDGTTSTATNPGKTYSAAGTYNVALTVTDNLGATNTVTKAVAVTAPPGNALTKGVAVTGLSAATGGYVKYTMVVPAGASNLTFTISGGTGDADMYVKFGSEPTDTAYDCRPYKTGNAETCTFVTPSAGTYYINLKAYAAFSGVSLVGDYSTGGGGTQTYSNTSDYAISDNATVDSPITVSGRSGNAPSNASVTVAIVHTYIGDLKVDLVAPDGTLYNIHNRTGGSADNINRTVTLNLSSEALNGTWKLRVNDNASGDTGYIDNWSVTF